MKPGCRWISQQRSVVLRDQPHFLKDSRDLVEQVRTVFIPEGARIIKFDIKGFFMSGTHHDLLDCCCALVPPGIESAFRNMLFTVLSSQLIRLDDSNRAWAVRVGSGMGLSCSGEVSDATFYSKVERDFVLSPSVRAQYGIYYYGRFKDDGLIIMGGSHLSRVEFFESFRARSGCFRIEVEPVDGYNFSMLDIEFFQGKNWVYRKLDYKPWRKPLLSGFLWPPLLDMRLMFMIRGRKLNFGD